MIRDMSRSTMIIVAVIAVACVASGLAYTAMVINSDNSSSAEYGLVSFEYDGSHATSAQIFDPADPSKLKLVYQDEGKTGDIYLQFVFSDLDPSFVASLYPSGFVMVEVGGDTYTGTFSSASDTSVTVTGDIIPLDFTDDRMEFAFGISTSDGKQLTLQDFSDGKYHLTVHSYHLEAE